MIGLNLSLPRTLGETEHRKELGRLRTRACYWRNPARASEWARKFREADPERSRTYARKHRASNRVEMNARARELCAANPDRTKAKTSRARMRLKQRPEYGHILRERNFKNNYGITVEQYDALVVAQGGLCAICHTKPEGNGSHKVLHVDYAHGTRKVRGLLCGRCNVMLGYGKDNVEILAAAIAYLERSN